MGLTVPVLPPPPAVWLFLRDRVESTKREIARPAATSSGGDLRSPVPVR